MAKKYEIAGQRFNRLYVVEEVFGGKAKVREWRCLCDCGEYTVLKTSVIVRGITKSCGCLADDTARERHLTHGCSHKPKEYPEYEIWSGIKKRCFIVTDPAYPDYGGRGISMSPEWRYDFLAFLNYVGRRPSKKHSLDRIDNNGNYEEGNVRWVTWDVQSKNRRSNVFIEHNGERKILKDWARELGLWTSGLTKQLEKKTFAEVYNRLS